LNGFDNFPKHHKKILLGDFNAKVGRENIFKPTIGNELKPRKQYQIEITNRLATL